MSETCSTCACAPVWRNWNGAEFVTLPCPILHAASRNFKETRNGMCVNEETFYCACYRPKEDQPK